MKFPKPVKLFSAAALLAGAGCTSAPYIAECPHNDFLEGYSDYSSCRNAVQAHEETTGHEAECFRGIID